jgi:hypothetical protein
MAKRISTEKYELIGIRRIKLKSGRYAQIAVRRVAYGPDRLYAWRGRHSSPAWECSQGSYETDREFRESL